MKTRNVEKNYSRLLLSLNHSRNVLAVLMQACESQEKDEADKIYSTLLAADTFLDTAQTSAEALNSVIYHSTEA
jgi:hypothetical protein